MLKKTTKTLAILTILFITTPVTYAADNDYRAIEQLTSKGFVKCAKNHATTASVIDSKDEFAYLNLWNDKNPNKHMGTTLISKKYSDGETFAAISTTPTLEGGCDSNFMQVFATPETCPKVRDTTFKNWKFYGNIGSMPAYEDPTSSSVTVTLLTVENSCLVIKHGALFYPVESNK